MQNISWFLLENFNEKPSLFQNEQTLNYKVLTHVCSCGKINLSLIYDFQDLKYQCHECGNKIYYDAYLAQKNLEMFLQICSKQIILQEEVVLEEESVVASCYINIPHYVDYLREKVEFIKKRVFSYSLSKRADENFFYDIDPKDTVFRKTILLPEINKLEEIKQILRDKCIKYILDNACFGISRVKEYKNLNYFQLLFFLENPLLNNLNYYEEKDHLTSYFPSKKPMGWIKIESIIESLNIPKSIKKVVYENYEMQTTFKTFIFNYIVAFCNSIDDRNILKQLIMLNLEKEYMVPYKDIYEFIYFLKKYYTEKQILQFFKSVKEVDGLIYQDTIGIYRYLNNSVWLTDFQKVKCRLLPIHNEINRIYNKEVEDSIKDIVFTYSKNEKRLVSKIDDYEIKLPQNGPELKEWGDTLHNCLITYASTIEDKISCIYAFYNKKKIEFAVEIQAGRIIQQSSFYNQKLTKKQQIILKKWRVKYLNKSFYRQNMTKETSTIPIEIN
ncbi:MAG TPA: hypothetical protein CFH82_07440 [Sulfurospirillum sp. UBA12182]|nr:MAG TPA: hypothetical protein CFH82_07440 [Sulfurospirillum sp. UBA12182]